jgi:hypothetical protein
MLPPVAKIHLKPSIRHNFYGFNNDSLLLYVAPDHAGAEPKSLLFLGKMLQ